MSIALSESSPKRLSEQALCLGASGRYGTYAADDDQTGGHLGGASRRRISAAASLQLSDEAARKQEDGHHRYYAVVWAGPICNAEHRCLRYRRKHPLRNRCGCLAHLDGCMRNPRRVLIC